MNTHKTCRRLQTYIEIQIHKNGNFKRIFTIYKFYATENVKDPGTGQDMPLSVKNHRHSGVVSEDHWHKTSILIDIKEHKHSARDIVIDGHSHPENRGCFDIPGALPVNINVFINGIKVNAIPINQDVEINITQYLQTDMLNNIEITTGSYGRVYAHLYSRSFIRW